MLAVVLALQLAVTSPEAARPVEAGRDTAAAVQIALLVGAMMLAVRLHRRGE